LDGASDYSGVFDVISTYVAEVAIDHPSNEGDLKSYGEAAHNFYYYRLTVSRLGMGDHPDLSPPRANCPPGLSETYIGDNSLDDDRSNPEQPILDGRAIGLVANNYFDTTNRSSWAPIVAVGQMAHVADEVSATDDELLAMRKSVQSVFDDDDDSTGALPEGWVTDEDNTATYSCSGPGHVTNPRRPTQ
jgi:hypothetical protein